MIMTDLAGGCLCGSIRYSVSGPSLCVSHCHCTFCRRAAGAAFITWMTLGSGDFVVTDGEITEFQSSPGVWRGFCVGCGTSLTYRHVDHGEEMDLAAATLDDQAAVVPDDHIWVDSMVPWLEFADTLPRLATQHWEHGYPKRD
jgi:hypothetical protein